MSEEILSALRAGQQAQPLEKWFLYFHFQFESYHFFDNPIFSNLPITLANQF